jgi:predicted permease
MQRVIHVIGRLSPGATPDAAHAALMPLFNRFAGTVPADFRQAVPMQLRVPALQRQQTDAYRAGLLILFGAVLAFVLMSCANVASLLLARSEARRHEFAVRSSLGASPARLIAQTVIESLVLGLAAGITGCGLAWVLLESFRLLTPTFTVRFGAATVDWRVLTFAVLLSLISALLFGLAPALDRRRGENLAAPRIAGGTTYRLRSLLTSAQFAVSVVLLTLTGLFSLSLWTLRSVELGFLPDRVVTAGFVLPAQRFTGQGVEANQRLIGFFHTLEERLRDIPGIDAVAITDSLPPGGDPRSFPWVALLGGGDASTEGKEGLVKWRFVTEDFLTLLGIPLKHGRGFTSDDRLTGPHAVIVNEAFALRRFGRTDVVGEGVYCAQCVIVGVARNVRNSGLRAPATPEMWVLRRRTPDDFWNNQRPPFGWRAATVVVRSTQDPRLTMQTVERVIQEVQPGMPVISGTLSRQLDEYFEQPRFQTALLTLFALTGLGLAALGLYGLTSYLAAARTREIGVRMALGASRRDIVTLLMRGGLLSTGVGMVVGALVAVALIHAARSMLAELPTPDARVLPAILLPLAIAAIAGAGLPGLRAARTDPARALRHD